MRESAERAMSNFDRVAWYCSWVAPASWTVAILAFILSVFVERESALPTTLPGIALVAASLGLVAHMLLTFHVSRARLFSSDERAALLRALWFGLGYQRWRNVVRGHRG